MKSETRRKRRSSEFNKIVSEKKKVRKRRMSIAAAAALFFGVLSVVTFSTTTSAVADECSDPLGPQTGCVVPEISALEGTAALALVAAMLLLAWERRRRSV